MLSPLFLNSICRIEPTPTETSTGKAVTIRGEKLLAITRVR